MLCYATKLKVNDTFTKEKLLQNFYQFIGEEKREDGRKNKNYMPGIPEITCFPFEYCLDYQQAYIKEDEDILGLRYTFQDPRIQLIFIVDLLYDSKNRELYYQFSKELTEDSVFIANVNIPHVFRKLMKDDYMARDSGLIILPERPYHFDSFRTKNRNFQLPVVIMRTKKNHFPLDPNRLNDALAGIGHVILVHQQNEHLDDIEIVYPDGKHEWIQDTNPKLLEEKLRAYCIDYFYDDTISFENLKLKETKEEIDRLANEKEELQDILEDQNEENKKEKIKNMRLKAEYEALLKQKAEIESNLTNTISEKEVLIEVDVDKKDECAAYLMKILKHEYNNFNSIDAKKTRKRRKDILKDVLKHN